MHALAEPCALTALREDLGNDAFAPEAWNDTAVAPPDFDSHPFSELRGLLQNGRGLPLLQWIFFVSSGFSRDFYSSGRPLVSFKNRAAVKEVRAETTIKAEGAISLPVN